MLEHAYKRSPSRYRFTPYETASIIKAHKLLLEDLSKKPLSLQMLSRSVAINEFKLKAGFRQIFECFDVLHNLVLLYFWRHYRIDAEKFIRV